MIITLSLLVVAGAAPRATAAEDPGDPGTTTPHTETEAEAQRRPSADDDPWEPPPDDEPEPEPDPDPTPPPPPPPDPQCDDAAGFARPTGTVPPGYVYSPTKFNGIVADPQPDDTFAVDAPGHAAHVGKLRTRQANGREELLVCAHVGTNTPTDALTPFPLTGPGGHPATISPRVVIIDATGASTTYQLGAPGIDGTLSHYAGSTDVHQGYVQMWVPFTANMREPGFVVRVEIRGTPGLPGGATEVMGADEVYVHLGGPPQFEHDRVQQALGVALDDGAIGPRPDDPGADDLSTLLAPHLEPFIAERIESFAPMDIPSDWNWEYDWEWGPVLGSTAGGRLHSLETFVHSFRLDVENFSATEGRLLVTFQGTARPKMTLQPRSVAAARSIFSGSCEVESVVNFSAGASFTVDLSSDLTRPRIETGFVLVDGTTSFIDASGDLWALFYGAPHPLNCNAIESNLENGVVVQVKERLQGLSTDDELEADLEGELNTILEAGDLADGPLSSAGISLPNGVGFGLELPRYVPTAPAGHVGGDVDITTDGVDLAAGILVRDQGGQRFPFSYVPSAARSVVSATNDRTRPSGSDSFDVGLVVSGATVNHLSRALAAGKPVPITAPPGDVLAGLVGPGVGTVDVGLLDLLMPDIDIDGEGPGTITVDVATRPSVPPMYLPTPPTGWPAPGNINLLLPSLRIAIADGTNGAGLVTMATDVSVGLDATIDATDHLVPTVQDSEVAARFLRLGATINQMPDPGLILGTAAAEIREAVPSRLAEVLRPVRIPDLSADIEIGGTPVHLGPVHLGNLTVGTVGGGHLGAYVDVLAGPPPPPPPTVVTSWATGPGGAPTSFTTEVIPTGVGGSGAYNVRWTVTDLHTNGVIYQSPVNGEAATTKTFPASGLGIVDDQCTGEHIVAVAITAVVTRPGNGQPRTESGTAGHSWAGTPPIHPPSWCEPPEPEPEPEPEDDPPVCRRKPWLCEEQP